jgi:hypothetical protein
LARSYSATAIKTLAGVMTGRSHPAAARVAAANALLDRGWGKPTQELEHTGKGGGPIVTTEAMPLPPLPVAKAVKQLFDQAERELGLASGKGNPAAKRARRILDAAELLPPAAYAAIYAAGKASDD